MKKTFEFHPSTVYLTVLGSTIGTVIMWLFIAIPLIRCSGGSKSLNTEPAQYQKVWCKDYPGGVRICSDKQSTHYGVQAGSEKNGTEDE